MVLPTQSGDTIRWQRKPWLQGGARNELITAVEAVAFDVLRGCAKSGLVFPITSSDTEAVGNRSR